MSQPFDRVFVGDVIAEGTILYADQIACVSTDHAPWPVETKRDHDSFACPAGLIGLQSFAPPMFTLLDERGVGSDCDILVLERGDFTFDEASIVDRPELRWSPYHGRRMRARVAATVLRGALGWDGTTVLATPGTGRFVPRRTH